MFAAARPATVAAAANSSSNAATATPSWRDNTSTWTADMPTSQYGFPAALSQQQYPQHLQEQQHDVWEEEEELMFVRPHRRFESQEEFITLSFSPPATHSPSLQPSMAPSVPTASKLASCHPQGPPSPFAAFSKTPFPTLITADAGFDPLRANGLIRSSGKRKALVIKHNSIHMCRQPGIWDPTTTPHSSMDPSHPSNSDSCSPQSDPDTSPSLSNSNPTTAWHSAATSLTCVPESPTGSYSHTHTHSNSYSHRSSSSSAASASGSLSGGFGPQLLAQELPSDLDTHLTNSNRRLLADRAQSQGLWQDFRREKRVFPEDSHNHKVADGVLSTLKQTARGPYAAPAAAAAAAADEAACELDGVVTGPTKAGLARFSPATVAAAAAAAVLAAMGFQGATAAPQKQPLISGKAAQRPSTTTTTTSSSSGRKGAQTNLQGPDPTAAAAAAVTGSDNHSVNSAKKCQVGTCTPTLGTPHATVAVMVLTYSPTESPFPSREASSTAQQHQSAAKVSLARVGQPQPQHSDAPAAALASSSSSKLGLGLDLSPAGSVVTKPLVSQIFNPYSPTGEIYEYTFLTPEELSQQQQQQEEEEGEEEEESAQLAVCPSRFDSVSNSMVLRPECAVRTASQLASNADSLAARYPSTVDSTAATAAEAEDADEGASEGTSAADVQALHGMLIWQLTARLAMPHTDAATGVLSYWEPRTADSAAARSSNNSSSDSSSNAAWTGVYDALQGSLPRADVAQGAPQGSFDSSVSSRSSTCEDDDAVPAEVVSVFTKACRAGPLFGAAGWQSSWGCYVSRSSRRLAAVCLVVAWIVASLVLLVVSWPWLANAGMC